MGGVYTVKDLEWRHVAAGVMACDVVWGRGEVRKVGNSYRAVILDDAAGDEVRDESFRTQREAVSRMREWQIEALSQWIEETFV